MSCHLLWLFERFVQSSQPSQCPVVQESSDPTTLLLNFSIVVPPPSKQGLGIFFVNVGGFFSLFLFFAVVWLRKWYCIASLQSYEKKLKRQRKIEEFIWESLMPNREYLLYIAWQVRLPTFGTTGVHQRHQWSCHRCIGGQLIRYSVCSLVLIYCSER